MAAERAGALTVAATAAALLAALALALLFIVLARGGDNMGLGRVISPFTKWAPARLTNWLAFRYAQFRDGVLLSLRRVPLAGCMGLLGWLAEICRLYLVTQALDIHLPLPLIVFATLANSLLTLVPTPGGVGAVEAGLVGLLKQLSMLATPAVVALVLVDRSISYLSVIVTGALLFLVRWVTRHKSRQPAASEAILSNRANRASRANRED